MARSAFLHLIENGAGLEIGGPSHVFSDFGILPLYGHVRSLDNYVFSEPSGLDLVRNEKTVYTPFS
jgi:hypothetical protein